MLYNYSMENIPLEVFMAGRKNVEEYYEEERPSRAPRVIACGLLYLLSGFFLFALFVGDESPFAGVRDVLKGLGGAMAFLVAVFFAWIATLLAFTLRGKRVSFVRSLFGALIFPCLHGLLHVFFVPQILQKYMTLPTFPNHIKQSYEHAVGGGAIGGLSAWPLQRLLGTPIAVFALLIALALALLCSGAIGKIKRKCNPSEPEPYIPQEDPSRVEVLDSAKKPRRNKKVSYNYDEEPPRRGKKSSAYNNEESPRGGESAESESGGYRSVRGENLDSNRRSTRTSDAYEPPRRSARRGQLYNESIESPNHRRRVVDDGTVPPRRENRRPAEADASESRSRRGENLDDRTVSANGRRTAPPETPVFRESRRAEDVPYDPDDLFEVHDDLTIEPEHADVLEGDVPRELSKPAKKPMGKLKRPGKAPIESEENYNYPPIDLLETGEKVEENYHDDDMQKARLLEKTLMEFGIETELTGIAHGPAVTRFEVTPAAGIKVSRITQLADDIAMRLAAMSVRIEAPIPGKSAVGVEIPNSKVETVRLRDVLESPEATNSASKLAVGLGKDNSGRYIVADIAKMPHVLIAGQTGSGKSVCINSIITSILFRAAPEEVKMILIDPKVVELSIYNGIPHLVCPVVTDCKKAASALQWAVAEMDRRYKVFAKYGVRDIKGYNKEVAAGTLQIKDKKDEGGEEDEEAPRMMPKMVIIIDELADLMMVAQGDVEESICRLAQLARAAGMHLVIATQRPSVNVITGTIKANIPTRIAFSVASQIDSRTMIDHGGAEKLLGNGDMLFVPSGINKPMRVQGAWVSDEEVHKITTYIKSNSEAEYDQDMIERMEKAVMSDAEKEDFNAEYDELLPRAVEIVVEMGQASVSMLQRKMRVGYARAGRLIDEMERRGIVSEADGSKPRNVLITREQINDLFEDE